jgi:dTMP kinase
LSLFVTFEGTEGCGKTTQISLLSERLRRDGHRVVTTREPGGTALGEALRAVVLDSAVPMGPEAEAYLMTAARAEHVRVVIRPALASGAMVLCDRFVDSTYAYQGGGRGLPVQQLRDLQALAVGDLEPDVTILLDLPLDVGLDRRARERGVNRIDTEDLAFHRRVAVWYCQEARAHPHRWVIVDADGSPVDVHARVLATLIGRLTESPATATGSECR